MKAEIKTERGRERIFVNGEPILSDSYITYLTGKARYLDFAERGYRLFSFPAFFSSKTLNENAQYPAFGEGIFDMPLPKWEIFDRNVEKILEACPDAYIFPRVNLSPAEAWERENSDELCDIKKGEVARPCFASEALEAEMKRMLGLLIDHVKSADYREHIIGYQLASGNTEEWLPFDMAGCIGKRSRERFGRYRREKGMTKLGLHDSTAAIAGLVSRARGRRGRGADMGSGNDGTLYVPYSVNVPISAAKFEGLRKRNGSRRFGTGRVNAVEHSVNIPDQPYGVPVTAVVHYDTFWVLPKHIDQVVEQLGLTHVLNTIALNGDAAVAGTVPDPCPLAPEVRPCRSLGDVSV